jgi:hypothetical protein
MEKFLLQNFPGLRFLKKSKDDKKLMKFKALGVPQKTDAKEGVITGVRLCTAGEAKGHGVFLEESFIDEVVAQSEKYQKMGLKCRFGHPTMCSEALGTALGSFKNVKKAMCQFPDPMDPEKTIEAAAAVGDLYLYNSASLTPNGDLRAYVLAAAGEHPDKFATSICFDIGDYYVYADDGSKIFWYATGCAWDYNKDTWNDAARKFLAAAEKTGKICVTCETLYGCDMVDEPAANEGGLFSAFSSETMAGQVTTFLDDHPKILELLEKSPDTVSGFFDRYNQFRKDRNLPELKLAAVAELDAARKELATAKTNIVELATAADDLNKQLAEHAGTIADLKTKLAAAETSASASIDLSAKNDSLSAELAAEKTKNTELQALLSVERNGADPVKFGAPSISPSGKPANDTCSSRESAEAWVAKAESNKTKR